MAYKICNSEPAEQDIDEILSYMAETLNNVTAARSFADNLDDTFSVLEEQPYSFASVQEPDLLDKGYHKFFIGNYIGFFTIEEDEKTVIISRIIYMRRDMLRHL
jgi:plasmid stabilization system protein ParE